MNKLKILSTIFTLIQVGLGFYCMACLCSEYIDVAIAIMFVLFVFSFISERILFYFERKVIVE